MPGYLTQAEMRAVKAALPDEFDAAFIDAMRRHHAGAVRMADRMWQSRGDPRLRIMAHANRHEQQGEIAMHGVEGVAAVTTAVRNLLGDNAN